MSRYGWWEEKARANFIKHGITFQQAETVLLDLLHRTWPDLTQRPDDRRFLTIGHSNAGRLLLVVTSERGPRPRIISARRATKRERHAYEDRP
jgi:uncharacterized DUF497 family protein